MRIVTCTNSPVRVDGDDLVAAAPGGVVPMVAALLRAHGGDWLFVADGSAPPAPQAVTIGGATTRLLPVPVGRAAAEGHHGQFSIQVLQWTLHYLHETAASPTYDRRMWSAWDSYAEVNRLMAGRMRDAAADGEPAPLGLVNDHQFLLVPEFLRAFGWAGQLVYFHQLPWCDAGYLATIPERMRERLLRSMLCCDVAGFHARRWAEAFQQCCERFLPEVTICGDHIVGPERRTRVVVAPGLADEAALARTRDDPRTAHWRTELQRLAAGRRLLIRAERFDLWKNVRRGLLAFEDLLAGDPAVAADIWFCALLSRPRRATDRHRADEAACEAVADRINQRYGRPGRSAVSLLYGRPGANGQHRVVAALELGAATLVNPTYDGLNLVAVESLLLAPRSPVVLSVNAGAYESLARHTIGVDPFDVCATTDALGRALSAPAPAVPAAAANPTRSARGWLDTILGRPSDVS